MLAVNRILPAAEGAVSTGLAVLIIVLSISWPTIALVLSWRMRNEASAIYQQIGNLAGAIKLESDMRQQLAAIADFNFAVHDRRFRELAPGRWPESQMGRLH